MNIQVRTVLIILMMITFCQLPVRSQDRLNLVLNVNGQVPAEGSVSEILIQGNGLSLKGEYLPGELVLSQTDMSTLLESSGEITLTFTYFSNPEELDSKVEYCLLFSIDHFDQRYVLLDVDNLGKRKKRDEYRYIVTSPLKSTVYLPR